MRPNFGFFFSQNSEMKHFSGIQTKRDTSSVSTQKAQPCWRWKMGSRKDFFQLKKSMVATTQTSSFTKTDEHWGEKNPPKRLKYEKWTIKYRTAIPKALQNPDLNKAFDSSWAKEMENNGGAETCTVFVQPGMCTWKNPPSWRSWAPPGANCSLLITFFFS